MKTGTLSPLATVIIPVFDDVAGLTRTLESIRRNVAQPIEVIVCNDGGPADVAQIASKFDCRYVRLPNNSGAYAARNAGILAARSEILAFIDADETVDPAWIRSGLEALETADYAGGRIVVVADGSIDPWERYDADRGFRFVKNASDESFPTGNLFVRREVFQSVGLFDQRLRSTGDTEFADRVRSRGVRVGAAPGAITYHPPRQKLQVFSKNRRISSGRAQLFLLVKRQSFFHLILKELWGLTLAPLRLFWRCLRRQDERRRLGVADFVRFLVYDEVMLVHRTVWLLYYGSHVKSRKFSPFQDRPMERD